MHVLVGPGGGTTESLSTPPVLVQFAGKMQILAAQLNETSLIVDYVAEYQDKKPLKRPESGIPANEWLPSLGSPRLAKSIVIHKYRTTYNWRIFIISERVPLRPFFDQTGRSQTR